MKHRGTENIEGQCGNAFDQAKGTLNFLGYSFRYDRDIRGYNKKYLNMFPSDKSVKRIKQKLKE